MAAGQHLSEHLVSVCIALIGALGVLVVDPAQHDYLAGRVEPEEQPVLLEEFGPEPVLVFVAKRVALPVFGPCRVLGDRIERQVDDGREPLGGILFCIALRVFCAQAGYLLEQFLVLVKKKRMRKDRPAMDDHTGILGGFFGAIGRAG